jgi:hypothetical protein
LSHMIPRSVPVIAKRYGVVSFRGSVTQLTRTPRRRAGCRRGGTWRRRGGAGGATRRVGNPGYGRRHHTRLLPHRGLRHEALRIDRDSRPRLGNGALSLAFLGRCPIGGPLTPGTSGVAAAFGAVGGWASAAAPVHGSAAAGGATTIAATRPMVATEATGIDAIRANGDMSHLSRSRTPQLTSRTSRCDDSDRWGGCDH